MSSAWEPWAGAVAGLAREAFSAARYLVMRRQVKQRIAGREAVESMRRGDILLSQMCPLHGIPRDAGGLQRAEAEQPLWCGCWWHRDVIYRRDGTRQRVIRVGRRDPVTAGRWLVASFADTGEPPSEEVLEQVREALARQERLACA